MKRIWIPQVIASLLLLWALYPENPYGYYVFLRWMCLGIFGWLALYACCDGLIAWAWILGILAVVYNPFVRIHLDRDLWSIINVVSMMLCLASIVALKHPQESECPTDGESL